MAHTERRTLKAEPGTAWWDEQNVTQTWDDERNVSHSKPCWMCGKGREAKRKQHSKPQRAEGKRIIAQGQDYWG